MTVFVWTHQGHIQIDPDGSPAGGPCLQIPATQDAVWKWYHAMMSAVDDGEVDMDLPGEFLTIPERDHV